VSRERKSSPIPTIVAVLVASVGVHVLLWPVGNKVMRMHWGASPVPIGGGVMEVSLMPLEATPEEKEDEEANPEEPEESKDRLVNLDRLVEERPPDKTDNVSEFDNRVDRETRAPNRRRTPGDTQTQPGDRPDGAEGSADQESDAQRNPSSKALNMGRDAAGRELDGKQADSHAPSKTAEDGVARHDPGKAGSLNPRRGLQGLPEAMRRPPGSHGSIDDLDGIDDGDENVLNSRRWKYASFFNRVRNGVSEHWNPQVVHRANDPDGRVHGTKTRRTKLIIFLNPDGSLHRIRIESSSEVDYLDEEAIRAVRTAQPFANPPAGLVNPNTGLIEFGFAFIFEIHGGRRIHRYQR
jgi:TonB family protein